MTATVPLMITAAMKAELRARGYTDAQIFEMRPEQAHAILMAVPAPPMPANDAAPVPDINHALAFLLWLFGEWPLCLVSIKPDVEGTPSRAAIRIAALRVNRGGDRVCRCCL